MPIKSYPQENGSRRFHLTFTVSNDFCYVRGFYSPSFKLRNLLCTRYRASKTVISEISQSNYCWCWTVIQYCNIFCYMSHQPRLLDWHMSFAHLASIHEKKYGQYISLWTLNQILQLLFCFLFLEVFETQNYLQIPYWLVVALCDYYFCLFLWLKQQQQWQKNSLKMFWYHKGEGLVCNCRVLGFQSIPKLDKGLKLSIVSKHHIKTYNSYNFMCLLAQCRTIYVKQCLYC